MEQLATQLQALSLTEKQAKVYVANLFLGPAPAQRIAQQANINRPTTYDILDELAHLGLVSRSVEQAKTLFIAAGPEALERLMQRQSDEISQRRRMLQALLPQINAIERSPDDSQPLVRFVKGKQGVDDIRAYAVRKTRPGSEVLSMTNHDQTLRVYPDQLKTNPLIRLSKKLSSKQFYFNSKHAVAGNPEQLKETIRLEDAIPADVTLYEDKAVLLSYGTGDHDGRSWSGIIIENKEIVAALRQLFHLAWIRNDKNEKKSVE